MPKFIRKNFNTKFLWLKESEERFMKFMGAKVKLKFQTHKDIYVIRLPIQTIEKGRTENSIQR